MPASPSAAPGACVRRGEAGNPAFPGAVCGAALRARAREPGDGTSDISLL